MIDTRKRIRCATCPRVMVLPRGADAGTETCDRCFFGDDPDRNRAIRRIRMGASITVRAA